MIDVCQPQSRASPSMVFPLRPIIHHSAYLSAFLSAFLALASIRSLAAFFSPLADCDETFNYWEPLHYLLFRFGLQTWEYSPIYALRSYAFLAPYAIVAKLVQYVHRLLIPHLPASPVLRDEKIAVFYILRLANALLTALAETTLIRASAHKFRPRVAVLLFFFLLSSPGMFRASVELLPSSFAMVALMFAFAAWFTEAYFVAVFFVALAAMLAWIYAAVLAIPMALHMLIRKNGAIHFFKASFISAVVILLFIVPIDTFFYGKLTFPLLNHVWYNVFPEHGAGSHLFGVDTYQFYVFNLLLNCNVPALLMLAFPLVLCVAYMFAVYDVLNVRIWERVIFLSPTYLALAVFFSQAHKEERFLAPCYPFIAVIAAVALSDCIQIISAMFAPKSAALAKKCTAAANSTTVLIRIILPTVVIAVSCVLGVSRIVMQVNSYGAPLSLYQRLSVHELRVRLNASSRTSDINICVGKEWHRFPNSFFFPHRRFRLRFVRASFMGLLPKPFSENSNGSRVIPSGMNSLNRADDSQFFEWRQLGGCHYFIDLDLSHREDARRDAEDDGNPIPEEGREIILRAPFLDSEMSTRPFRGFAIPGFKSKLVYGEYQVIRNSLLAE